MSKDFELVERRPTPHELLGALVAIFPTFQNTWDSEENYFRNKDGSFTYHGIFSEMTTFIRNNYEVISEDSRTALFRLVEECVNTDTNSESGVSNAACTCFLENLAGEGKFSENVSRYLGPNSKEYFEKWNQ